MPEVPDYQSMMLPILKRAAEGEINTKGAVEAVAAEFHLTPEDLAKLLSSGTATVASNRASWAMIYMQRAGLLHRERRGVYAITQRGRDILSSNPPRVDNQLLRQFPEFKQFQSGSGASTSDEQPTLNTADDVSSKVTPSERLEEAYKTLITALSLELIDRILTSSPTFFEKMVVKLLTAMGYGGTVEEAASHIGGPEGSTA